MSLYKGDADKFSELFDSMAHQLFGKTDTTTSLIARVRKGVRCLLSDGNYDPKTIETALKSVFGESRPMFGYHPSSSGIKVAIPASSISDASGFLFTNYNPAITRPLSCGTIGVPSFEGLLAYALQDTVQ